MRYFIALVFLFIGNQSFVYSQNKVSGKITNEKNEPLAGAHIHAAQNFAVSDPIGNFAIDVPFGENRIVISYVGYKTVDVVQGISGNVVLNIQLKEDISALSEVEIKDNGFGSIAN